MGGTRRVLAAIVGISLGIAGGGFATAGGATAATSPSPAAAISGVAAIDISAGNNHSCAVLSDGRVACWGYGTSGQIGNGANNSASTPRAVVGITNATKVDAGNSHSCALLSDATVKCWGANSSGQLGNGNNAPSNVPVTVSGISNATAIGTGFDYSCALLADTTVKCWGNGNSGALGNGSTSNSNVPVAVSNLSGATAISLGAGTSCVLISAGGVQCWGYGGSGNLGNGSNSNSSTPVSAIIVGAIAISVGGASCALIANGLMSCWGDNTWGQLGNGTTASSNVPLIVPGLVGVSEISAGGGHTCARLAATLECWGNGPWGQLGNGQSADSHIPVAVANISTAVSVDAGGSHTCAILNDGSAQCWGRNDVGSVGDGTSINQNTPASVVGIGRPANDNFAYAEVIGGTGGVTQTSTSHATAEPNEPDHTATNQYPAQASVWYRYTAPATGTATFDACASDFDTIIEVYTGPDITGLVNTTYNDDACGPNGTQSLVNFATTAGGTYWISVDAFDGFTGFLTLEWQLVPTPPAANDTFANAVVMTGASGTLTGDSLNATQEAGEPAPFNSGQSLWYKFTPSAAGTMTIDTCGSSFATTLAVYRGAAVGALTQQALNGSSDGCSANSEVALAVSANVTYYVRVAGSGTATGAIALHWRRTAAGTPGRPAMYVNAVGDDWVSLSMLPPSYTGSSAITGYSVVTSGGPGSGTTTIPGAGTSATITGLTNGVTYDFVVTASNSAGASSPSLTVSFAPIAGDTAITTYYDASEATRVHANAVYFGSADDADAQKTSTFIIGFIIGLIPPGTTPLAQPQQTGFIAVNSTWTPQEQSVLLTVSKKYALSPSDAQHFSTQLVGFLLALGGH